LGCPHGRFLTGIGSSSKRSPVKGLAADRTL
jgi:hypothetical protein